MDSYNMEETNLICNLSLMYAVIRGMCAILEDDYAALRDGGGLERGAIDCGTWWLREQMDSMWPELRKKL